MKRILLTLLFLATQAVAQPIPGTVNAKQSGAWTNACTQSGTWTVQPGNTANSTPWLSTISQGGNSAAVSAAGALATNLAQVAGSTVSTGSGTATGALRVELPTNGTGVVGLNAGAATVGSIASITTSITPGTAAANLGKLEDGAAGSGDTLVGMGGRINTSLATLAADGDYTTPALDTVGRAIISGQVNHDDPVAGFPVLGAAEARTSEGTAVANGDAVRLTATTFGKLIVQPIAAPNLLLPFETANTSTTSPVTLRGAQGGSVRNCIKHFAISNQSLTTGTLVTFSDGTTSISYWAPLNSAVSYPVDNLCFGGNLAVTTATAVSVDRVRVSAIMYTTSF